MNRIILECNLSGEKGIISVTISLTDTLIGYPGIDDLVELLKNGYSEISSVHIKEIDYAPKQIENMRFN